MATLSEESFVDWWAVYGQFLCSRVEKEVLRSMAPTFIVVEGGGVGALFFLKTHAYIYMCR